MDAGIKTALEAIVRRLKARGADVRWVDAGGMHLTLKFLGWIDESRVARVECVLADVARRHAPFPLRLEGAGAFPTERSPRVLWIGFAAEPRVLALQADLETALEAEGFEREGRAFTPHLTLGRVKGRDRLAGAMSELARLRGESIGEMTVRALSLFESRLHPDGAEYRIVSQAGLS
jgi:2'-5' RNA ligase